MKMPKMFYIDGLDGSGKKTISLMVKKKLEDEFNQKVFVFDPPFYDTPTGKIVEEYLYDGYKGFRDRKLASLLYTTDRAVFLREHFDEMFSGDYDVILMNRGMLSSFFFNTTLEAQSREDDVHLWHRTLSDEHVRLNTEHTLFTFNYGGDTSSVLLDDIRSWLVVRYDDPRWKAVEYVYNYIRTMVLREHAQMLFELEVRPWWFLDDHSGLKMPFVDVPTIVLMPEKSTSFCENNVAHRRKGSGKGNDRNEQSGFLGAVHENIDYIKRHYHDIFGATRFRFWDMSRVIDTIDELWPGVPPVPIHQLPMPVHINYPMSAFSFDIVYTTELHGDMEIQRDLSDIFSAAWGYVKEIL